MTKNELEAALSLMESRLVFRLNAFQNWISFLACLCFGLTVMLLLIIGLGLESTIRENHTLIEAVIKKESRQSTLLRRTRLIQKTRRARGKRS